MEEIVCYGAQEGVYEDTHTVLKEARKTLVWDKEGARQGIGGERKGVESGERVVNGIRPVRHRGTRKQGTARERHRFDRFL